MFDNLELKKWSSTVGDRLWADLETDAERLAFLESGQAIATGIIAPAVVPDIVAIYRQKMALKELGGELCEVLGLAAVASFEGKPTVALDEIRKTEDMNLEILKSNKP